MNQNYSHEVKESMRRANTLAANLKPQAVTVDCKINGMYRRKQLVTRELEATLVYLFRMRQNIEKLESEIRLNLLVKNVTE